jgi:2-(1,2-epoxy-1,2-dihydrophenyl)acetyl-CoA isomerase
MPDALLIERTGAVARLKLNRPEIGNAIDIELARALHQAAIECDKDERVRCVILSGAGRMFCAGGDVRRIYDANAQAPALLKEITGHLHAAVHRFACMNKVVISAIHGPVAGAGIGLVCVTDFALASPSASFTLAYSAIGLSPDGGATWLLPRLIGARRAQDLCLSNRRLSAAAAAQMGLITKVVSSESLGREVTALAERIASGPVGALGATKRLLLDAHDASFEAQLEAEAIGIAARSASDEARIRIAAFVETHSGRAQETKDVAE